MHVQSMTCWTDGVTNTTTKAPTVDVFCLDVILHITASIGTEGTLQTSPVAQAVLSHVLHDSFV